MVNTSAAWKLTLTVIIVENIDITEKEKDNIVNHNRSTIIKKRKIIKNQQDKFYINNADTINGDIIIKKITYILSTKRFKTVIKSWRLELIIQSKKIIEIAIKQEIYIKAQENIMDKIHMHNTIG